MAGGTGRLLVVLRDHRGAVEYDFRSRFGVGLNIIGRDMSLAEASRLVGIIRADPSSALAASVEGWDHPVSRETAVLMDLWDLEMAKSGIKRPPTYSRPWKVSGSREQHGDVAGLSREQVEDILSRARRGDAAAPV